MGIATKSMKPFDLFSESSSEVGLPALARRSGRNKASVLRPFVTLVEFGLVALKSHANPYLLEPTIFRLVEPIRDTDFGLSVPCDGGVTPSISAPLFGDDKLCFAALTVVCSSFRLMPTHARNLKANLIRAARMISASYGREIPRPLGEPWRSTSNA